MDEANLQMQKPKAVVQALEILEGVVLDMKAARQGGPASPCASASL